MHHSFVRDDLLLEIMCRCVLLSLALGGRREKFDSTFEKPKCQDEVSSEASAFQREEVVLAKPFLVWHVAETSH